MASGGVVVDGVLEEVVVERGASALGERGVLLLTMGNFSFVNSRFVSFVNKWQMSGCRPSKRQPDSTNIFSPCLS